MFDHRKKAIGLAAPRAQQRQGDLHPAGRAVGVQPALFEGHRARDPGAQRLLVAGVGIAFIGMQQQLRGLSDQPIVCIL